MDMVDNSGSTVQLEFGRAMLYIENLKDKETPAKRFALRFLNTTSVTLLSKENNELPDDWLTHFEKDKLEPLGISYEYFSFNKEYIHKMMELAVHSKTVIGEKYDVVGNPGIQLGFWAGDIGLVIVADDMKIVAHSGEIELDTIPEMKQKWWDYWRKYWQLRESDMPMPYDALCEITIPISS